jgi:hypothetical protein
MSDAHPLLLAKSWFGAFALAFVFNVCQCAIFVRQQARRTARTPVQSSHVPTSRVQRAHAFFYASLLVSTSSLAVLAFAIVTGISRELDPSPVQWDDGICVGQVLWVFTASLRTVGYFGDTFVVLVLDYIYAATLDEMGLTGRSRQLKRERRIRGTARTLVGMALFFTVLLMAYDLVKTYVETEPALRAEGCIAVSAVQIFSTFTLHTYSAVILLSWVYLSLSLLLLLGRNARVAREARKRHLPSYELYRAALARIRFIVLSNIFALLTVFALIFVMNDPDGDLSISLPTDILGLLYNVDVILYYVINGFAFLHRRPNASARLIKVTSPMMAAMESTFTPSAPVNDAVGSPSCL